MGRKLLVACIVVAVYIGYSFKDSFDPESIKNKRVLITGASTGIGEQLAYQYARLGARLVITARRAELLQKVIRNCREVGDPYGDYHYIAGDMAVPDDTKRVVDETVERLSGLDVLVLNHVMPGTLGLWQGSQSNFTYLRDSVYINFHSYVYVASHAREHLERSGGSIIVVSSVAGKLPGVLAAPYSAAKFALDGFFGALRQEFVLRDVDVSVTLCVIGITGTDTAYRLLREAGKSEELIKSVPFMDPSEVALAIVKGGELRQRHVYSPYWSSMLVTQLRELCPYPLEALQIYFSTRT